jgi:hypothetical protein
MRRGLCIAALALLAGGCWNVDVAGGTLQCSPDGRCPSGYHCESDNKCWPDGTSPPVGTDDGGRTGMGGGNPDGGGPQVFPQDTVWICGGGGASMAADGETISWSIGSSGGVLVGGSGGANGQINFGNLSTSAE